MPLLNRQRYTLLLVSAGAFLFLLFYLPISMVLKGAFISDSGSFSFKNITNLLGSPYNQRIILFTIVQALLSTIFAILLGLPGAWIIATKNFPGKNILKGISAVPFVLPSILVVLGFVIFFGNNGFLNRIIMGITKQTDPPLKILYSMKAIILAHGFYNFPIVLRIVASLWEKLDPTITRAAESLGAGKTKVFFTITLPQIVPAILASAALIFVFCFTSFAVILVLGGGPSFTTIEVEIYRLARISLNMDAAAALAIVGIFITLIFVYLNVHFQADMTHHDQIKQNSEMYKKNKKTSPALRSAIAVYILILVLLIAAPVLSVIVKSFIKTSGGYKYLTFAAYMEILGQSRGNFGLPVYQAIINSLTFAFYSVIISIILGTAISYILRSGNKISKYLDTLFMLPVSVSSIILGLGYLKTVSSLNISLEGSSLLIIFAHSVIAFPFVTRSVKPVLDKIKPNLLYAALSLGQRPFKVFTEIELPLIKSAIFAGGAFAFAISIGEMNATILLADKNTLTIPIMIYRLIGAYNFTAACALGTVLIVITGLSFILMDYFGSHN